MAERRAAGFNIPLNFYDGPEVNSIPSRIRAAAIGVWALAGDYAATGLTDGYVPAGVLKTLGCTPKIRAALMVTVNKKGELSPLWIDARDGGIQLTNWAKHQRTNDEVTAYRNSEAERKRLAREARAKATASENAETSAECPDGQNTVFRTDVRDPKTETETEINTYSPTVESSPNVGGDERGLTAPVSVSASRLVATVIPDKFPTAVRTALRLKASELMTGDGIPADDVADALRRWLTKPDAGPGLLPNLVADVQRERAATTNGTGPKHKLRVAAELTAQLRAEENNQLTKTERRELT